MKYLLWLAIGVAVFYWVTRGSRPGGRRGARTATPATPADAAQPAASASANKRARNADQRAEDMLQCAHCGVHLPVSEAVLAAPGQSYCCQAHRLLHEQR